LGKKSNNITPVLNFISILLKWVSFLLPENYRLQALLHPFLDHHLPAPRIYRSFPRKRPEKGLTIATVNTALPITPVWPSPGLDKA
jgi:hypothetical protein